MGPELQNTLFYHFSPEKTTKGWRFRTFVDPHRPRPRLTTDAFYGNDGTYWTYWTYKKEPGVKRPLFAFHIARPRRFLMDNEASRTLNCGGVLFRTSEQVRAKGNEVRHKKRPAAPFLFAFFVISIYDYRNAAIHFRGALPEVRGVHRYLPLRGISGRGRHGDRRDPGRLHRMYGLCRLLPPRGDLYG